MAGGENELNAASWNHVYSFCSHMATSFFGSKGQKSRYGAFAGCDGGVSARQAATRADMAESGGLTGMVIRQPSPIAVTASAKAKQAPIVMRPARLAAPPAGAPIPTLRRALCVRRR